jgi:nucleoside-diphosphate kinase
MIERTLVIIKPDAMQRGLIGEIIGRFERTGLKLIGAKMMMVDEDLANKHYPIDREEFIIGMAQKTFDSCKDQGIDVKKQFGSDDPKVVGLMLQKWLTDFITSAPVMVLAWEGPHAVDVVRKIRGFTLPSKADPGTITGDFSFDSSAYANSAKRPIRNLVHASGDAKEANFEISLWFKPEELFDYETIHQRHMIEE